MEINFENLHKIDEILQKINILEQKINGEKRWLNINEASNYLGYSKDHIHKLKDSDFIENKHYYKKAGKLLFDKLELDNWVTTTFINMKNVNPKQIAESILKDLI